VQIDLNPMLLGFIGAAASASDPDTAGVLSGLDGIRVRVYKTIEDVEDVVAFIDEVSDELASDDWQQVVNVQDDEHSVRVFMQMDDDAVSGMTVMIVGDGNAAFINVAGSINPLQLGRVVAAIGGGNIFDSNGAINSGRRRNSGEDEG
jgi:hypothetical protein